MTAEDDRAHVSPVCWQQSRAKYEYVDVKKLERLRFRLAGAEFFFYINLCASDSDVNVKHSRLSAAVTCGHFVSHLY